MPDYLMSLFNNPTTLIILHLLWTKAKKAYCTGSKLDVFGTNNRKKEENVRTTSNFLIIKGSILEMNIPATFTF